MPNKLLTQILTTWGKKQTKIHELEFHKRGNKFAQHIKEIDIKTIIRYHFMTI